MDIYCQLVRLRLSLSALVFNEERKGERKMVMYLQSRSPLPQHCHFSPFSLTDQLQGEVRGENGFFQPSDFISVLFISRGQCQLKALSERARGPYAVHSPRTHTRAAQRLVAYIYVHWRRWADWRPAHCVVDTEG